MADQTSSGSTRSNEYLRSNTMEVASSPMSDRRLKSLNKQLPQLETKLILETIKSHFHVDAGGFLNEVEMIEVFSGKSRIDHIRSLIEVLKTKDNSAFATFCLILRNGGYGHWSKVLLDEAGLDSDFNEQDSLKVSNLPKNFTEAQFKDLLVDVDPYAVVRLFRVPSQPTDYGYVNCSSEEAALQIKDKLNNLTLDDCKVNVKFKASNGPSQGQGRKMSASLKVVDLPQNENEDTFKKMTSGVKGLTSSKFISSEPPHGFLVFDCKESALIACNNLTQQGYKVSLCKK